MATTVSKALAQQIVNTVHDICGHDINFINNRGIIFASTDSRRIGTFHEIGKEAADTLSTIEVTKNGHYKGTSCGVNVPVTHGGLFLAVIGISGDPDKVRSYAQLAERITKLLIREQEQSGTAHTLSEKKRFLLNSLTGGGMELPKYALLALKDFHIDENTKKRVLIVRLHIEDPSATLSFAESKAVQLFERLGITLYSDYYPDKFIALADDALIMENMPALKSFCADNKDTVQLGIGCAADIYRLDESLHTANVALDNTSIEDVPLILFDSLTLEIILSAVPAQNRTEYLARVLRGLSGEDILLLRTYYEEGQSLSRTCEKLFLHKNTLQYKLDRIRRICGFNPRDFKDAVILYLAIRMHGGEK